MHFANDGDDVDDKYRSFGDVDDKNDRTLFRPPQEYHRWY
jgi:hypothetical protein